MITLLLIRHGENDLVGKGLAGRLPAVHLNAKGREQAQTLADNLAGAPICAIYSSPLERAIETAQPLAERLGIGIKIRPELIEVDYGEWQGKTFKQLQRLKLWKTVQAHPAEVRFPNGESLTEAQMRAGKEIESLVQFHKSKDVIACFTHADVIRLSAAYFLGLNLDYFQRLSVFPASVTTLAFQEEMVRVLQLNQVFSLDWSEMKKGRKRKNIKN
ncbi:MAG: MSMEG_4193 family putative phosphomutase [Anaerolineaceae bacterium]|nr:MSMEG_4193 family putative phosphomutase [Anaerolineaceae bacterium]